MRAKAAACMEKAFQTDRLTSSGYFEAARQWADLAAKAELLDREPVYRIIRRRKDLEGAPAATES